MKLGLVQMACSQRSEENLDQAVSLIEQATRQGANVICLPELFRTPYFCQREDAALFDLSEPIPGPTTQHFSKLARAHQVTVVVSVFERRTAGVYHNSLAVLDPAGDIVGLYRKMHIPDDPAYYEKFYFTPGDRGFQAIKTPYGTIGLLICWDQWYPEAARMTALQGAEVLLYPTAIGWHPQEKDQEGEGQREAWVTIQRSHAIANGVFVASVNRVGFEAPDGEGAGLEFWGSSFVCDPFGVMKAQASVDREEVLIADIDVQRIEEVRRHWPFLRDRRIDAYSGIAKRYLEDHQVQ